MGKKLEENILLICIAGVATIFGFALMIYTFVADTIRTEIVSASPIRTSVYETQEKRSENDPDYDPVYNKTKTVEATKYYRTVTMMIDREKEELELSSAFKFMLPGEGRKITVSREYDGGLYWEHPIRDMLMGIVFSAGGLGIIIFTIKSDRPKNKSATKKNSSSNGKGK